MNRSRIIIGVMILLVAASWITTFIFYNRLPVEIPMHFSFGDEMPGMKPSWYFLIFPVIATVIAVGMFILLPFRKFINFPGKKRLKDLPEELTGPVYNRAYQITVMNINFMIMLFIYMQVNIALYSLGRLDRFNVEVMLIVVGVIVFYSLFSFFTLNKMTKLARALYEKWKEEEDS